MLWIPTHQAELMSVGHSFDSRGSIVIKGSLEEQSLACMCSFMKTHEEFRYCYKKMNHMRAAPVSVGLVVDRYW